MLVERLFVEVAYALPHEQFLAQVRIAPGTTIAEAIEQSGVMVRFPEIDLKRNRVGVFGRMRGVDEIVLAGERIEIYRPLRADPKVARRRRAERATE